MPWLVGQSARREAPRVAVIERCRVIPALAKGDVEIADCRSPYFQLDVMPRRSGAIALVEFDRLAVPGVARVVTSTMTQVDAAHEPDVFVRDPRALNDDELLMVAAASSHAFIENGLSARVIDDRRQVGVALLREVRLPRVRPPQQPSDVYAPMRDAGEHATNFGTRSIEAFIAVALPIGEEHAVLKLE